jgi:hypothetical protein
MSAAGDDKTFDHAGAPKPRSHDPHHFGSGFSRGDDGQPSALRAWKFAGQQPLGLDPCHRLIEQLPEPRPHQRGIGAAHVGGA